jgi:hypothetical protein
MAAKATDVKRIEASLLEDDRTTCDDTIARTSRKTNWFNIQFPDTALAGGEDVLNAGSAAPGPLPAGGIRGGATL